MKLEQISLFLVRGTVAGIGTDIAHCAYRTVSKINVDVLRY